MKRNFIVVILLVSSSIAGATQPQSSDGDREYFEKKVRPILAQRCFSCHSSDAKSVRGGLRLDTASYLSKGGDNGAVVIPGRPDESLLIEAIRFESDDIQMPPDGKMPDEEIAELTSWVKRGAPFPIVDREQIRKTDEIDFELGRQFWSFQPLARQALPRVAYSKWPRKRLDFFILATLEQQGLQTSREADRRTLLRRLSFDLTGLPPSPEEVQSFVSDSGPDAYERQVDRLLQSPHFGERWGRVWLDLARYTDKTASWLHSTADAHLYRDWVAGAMNDDLSFRDFVMRQLATDFLPDTGPDDIPALGFLGLSPNYWKELQLPAEIIKVIVADELEERVDVVSRTFLGLTVACARCHDHKFDPISTHDYYAVAGIFASCRLSERPVIDEKLFEPVRKARATVEKLEKETAEIRKKTPLDSNRLAELSKQIQRLKSSTPYFDTPMANAVSEQSLYVVRAGKKPEDGTKLEYRDGPRDLHVSIRGNPNRLGELIPRRFLQVLSKPNSPPFTNGSGRLELAEAIVSQAAALTARVIVNRIWLAHFGRGIVDTPSNFGKLGDPPTHPRLLEDLAQRFVDSGWSLKWLHREIVLSATYRQASRNELSNEAVDPNNRWYWKMNRRRLDVESWRDAMLLASGDLDRTIGGASLDLEDSSNRRRTFYATIHRREMSTMLLTHDFPEPSSHSPRRTPTTTPLQSLYTLNGPLLAFQAKALVTRLERENIDADDKKIRRAYSLLYTRAPTEREMRLGLTFISASGFESRRDRWEQYAHVLLASNELLFVD